MQKLKVNACKFLGANQQVHLQKAQQQNKEAFQDGDVTQKAHQYLSSSNTLENSFICKMPLLMPFLHSIGSSQGE